MAKLTRATPFTPAAPKKETPLDKTSRAVKAITEGETEKRRAKTANLRKARLEKEEDTAS